MGSAGVWRAPRSWAARSRQVAPPHCWVGSPIRCPTAPSPPAPWRPRADLGDRDLCLCSRYLCHHRRDHHVDECQVCPVERQCAVPPALPGGRAAGYWGRHSSHRRQAGHGVPHSGMAGRQTCLAPVIQRKGGRGTGSSASLLCGRAQRSCCGMPRYRPGTIDLPLQLVPGFHGAPVPAERESEME